MPKLIDSEKLLKWLGNTEPGDLYIGGTLGEWIGAEIESGTFDPTPVQPDTEKDKAIEMIGWLKNSGMPVHPIQARILYKDAGYEIPESLKESEKIPKEITDKIDASIRELIRGGIENE
jgi:hypothetical protein